MLPAQFAFPRYDSSCISNVPLSIAEKYGVSQQRRLPHCMTRNPAFKDRPVTILFIVDGLGHHQLVAQRERSELANRLTVSSQYDVLTSVSPSTTATAGATLHDSLTPQQRPVLEYTQYVGEARYSGARIGRVIHTLPFREFDNYEPDMLLQTGELIPEDLYGSNPVYYQIRGAGVGCHNFVPHHMAYLPGTTVPRGFYRQLRTGSDLHPYEAKDDPAYDDLIGQVTSLANRLDGRPAYLVVYLLEPDKTGHIEGADSDAYADKVEESLTTIHRIMCRLNSTARKRSVVLVTADHGHAPVKAERMVYVNDFPGVMSALRKGGNGKVIVPTGAPNDVFLHLQPERRDEVIEQLRQELEDKAWVVEPEQALELGLFGTGPVTKNFREALGDVAIFPYPGHHVWYREDTNTLIDKGTHGGLSPAEMEVPFLIIDPAEYAG